MAPLPVARLLAAVLLCSILVATAAAAGRQDPAPFDPPAPSSLPEGSLGDAGRPAPADGPAGMVIVTDATLVPFFRRLANAHEKLGLVTRVRTLQSIRDAYPAGRDDAERIRMFLKDARADWGIEFALMGGDEPLIPMRRAYVDGLPIVFDLDPILLPTDQYYACLDGDWNADGDDRWAELANPATGDPGDAADMIPELCVGRAPVTTRQQAQDFVDKTARALGDATAVGALDVLLVSANFLPNPTSLFSGIAEHLRAVIDTASSSGATFTRLYRDSNLWPGTLPLTQASLLSALEQGHDLNVLLGAGGRGEFGLEQNIPPPPVTSDEFLTLHSTPDAPANQHVAMLSAYVTAPGILSVGAALVLARHATIASVLGPSDIEFVGLTDFYLQGYLDQALHTRGVTIGEAMRANLRTTTLQTEFGITRLTTLGNNLLGDPALPFPVGTAPPVAAVARVPGATAARGPEPTLDAGASTALTAQRPAASRPASPGDRVRASARLDRATGVLQIAFETPRSAAGRPLDVTVMDLAGRRVRQLGRTTAHAGPRSVSWDLRGDDGRRVRAGLYFVRIVAGDDLQVLRSVVW
jgi:hypothetical protein